MRTYSKSADLLKKSCVKLIFWKASYTCFYINTSVLIFLSAIEFPINTITGYCELAEEGVENLSNHLLAGTEAPFTSLAIVRMVERAAYSGKLKKVSFLKLCQKYWQIFTIAGKPVSPTYLAVLKVEPPQVGKPLSTPSQTLSQSKRELVAKIVSDGIAEGMLKSRLGFPSLSWYLSLIVSIGVVLNIGL